MDRLNDLINACIDREPVRVADAFNDIMLGKAHEMIGDYREEVARSMFNPDPEIEDTSK